MDENAVAGMAVRNYEIPHKKTIDFLNMHHLDFLPDITMDRRTDKALPVDAQAIDVICIGCYELIKAADVDAHSLKCNIEEPMNQ